MTPVELKPESYKGYIIRFYKINESPYSPYIKYVIIRRGYTYKSGEGEANSKADALYDAKSEIDNLREYYKHTRRGY